jgi:hypothetical protein
MNISVNLMSKLNLMENKKASHFDLPFTKTVY